MLHCGMTVKSLGTVAVSVRKMESRNVSWTLQTVVVVAERGTHWLRQMESGVFYVLIYEINSKILFLNRCFITGEHIVWDLKKHIFPC